MPLPEFYIAQGTYEASAYGACKGRFLLRMKEANRFVVEGRQVGHDRSRRSIKKSRKYVDAQQSIAGRAFGRFPGIEILPCKGDFTFRAFDLRVVHLSRLFPYDPCAADAIVQGSFLIVKGGHDISDE